MAANFEIDREMFESDNLDYEKRRQKNIKDNKMMLDKLLADLSGMPGIARTLKNHSNSPRTRKSLDCNFFSRRRNPSRSARRTSAVIASPGSIIRTRGQRMAEVRRAEDDIKVYLDDEEIFPEEKLIIKFGPCFKPPSPNHDLGSYADIEMDYDDETPKRRVKRSFDRRREPARRPEDISEQELNMIAESTKEKAYSAELGSTCHQCRQKTIDTKTICRSEGCAGVRGQFCGPCLRNRYGEDAREALLNPDWFCPPCRGICNCSFCRKKQGRHATGILIYQARTSGYLSVKHYLDKFS